MTGAEAVEQYLASGEFDPRFSAWTGNAVQRRARGRDHLRQVLLRVVRWRAEHAPLPPQPMPDEAVGRVRQRVHPMLHGLFPTAEAELLCRELPQRVQVVTLQRLDAISHQVSLQTLWHLGNMLLDDLGAPPLSDDQPTLEGFCAEGHAWVLPRAFASVGGADADPASRRANEHSDTLVHEVAHLLHELRRGRFGLAPERGLLLHVVPRRRETFAWTCELWACLLRSDADQASLQDRVAVLARAQRRFDARVDRAQLLALLSAAADAPDQGWVRIREGIRHPVPAV